MKSENKTFEEIMHNINNLTYDNYEETIKSMVRHNDDDERKELYNAFITEMKYNLINNEIYEDEALLQENIETIKNDLLDFDPSIESVLIENNFNLEAIIEERSLIHNNESIPEETTDEIAEEEIKESNDSNYENTNREDLEETNNENDIQEPKEIEIIQERIRILSRRYINIFKKEMLLFELNEKIDNIKSMIENEKENLLDTDEEIQSVTKERINLFEKEIEEIEKDVKNVQENYNELSNNDINLIIQTNEIDYDAFKESIKTSMGKGEILNYEAYKLSLERNELEEELSNIIEKVDQKVYDKYQKETPDVISLFENIKDEQLEDELDILKSEKTAMWSTEDESISDNINKNNENKSALEVLSEVDNISDKILIIETVLKIRALDKKIENIISGQVNELNQLNNLKFTRNTYYEIIKDAELCFENVEEKDLDENINEFLNNHRRIEKINSYENSEKLRKELIDEIKDNQKTEQLFVEKTEKNGKLWLKALAATAGFASGLAMSCVPGVGTIRMGISAAKLAGSAINLWTKKHPNGKIAKVKNNINDKLNDKFPRIMENANKMRAKLKQTPLNCFVNGVAAGYITGNIIEKLTGQTVFENIKNMFETEEVPGPILSPEEPIITPEPTLDVEVEVPEQTPIVNDPSINETIKPEPLPGIEDFPPINEDIIEAFIPKEGQVYDLSALAEGLVSSDATKSVGLMRSLGKEVVFDKAVQLPDGKIMWHFKQLNGAGYAWFNSTDVQEIMTKASDVVSKTM